jgi:hypothetical protein
LAADLAGDHIPEKLGGGGAPAGHKSPFAISARARRSLRATTASNADTSEAGDRQHYGDVPDCWGREAAGGVQSIVVCMMEG